MREIKFSVPGHPIGKQRPRVFTHRQSGKVMAMTPKKTAAYEDNISYGYISMSRGYRFPDKTKIRLDVVAYFKNDRRSDANNVYRLVADALEKIAYENDKYVVGSCDYFIDKENPRLEVTVGPYVE